MNCTLMGSSTLKKEDVDGEGNVKNIAKEQSEQAGDRMIVGRMGGGGLLFCGNQFEIKAQRRLRRRTAVRLLS